MGFYQDKMEAKRLIECIVLSRSIAEDELEYMVWSKWGFGMGLVNNLLNLLDRQCLIKIEGKAPFRIIIPMQQPNKEEPTQEPTEKTDVEADLNGIRNALLE